MSNSGGERGGGGGGAAPPCGACKFLRRKCVKGCIFSPYFDSEQGTAHFAAVHKVFGASNASKLLMRIPPHHRLDAVVTLCYEALARVRDPVYGCVAHIFTLQHQVVNLQAELGYIQARLANLHGTSVFGQLTTSHQPQPPQQPHHQTTSHSLVPATTEAAGTLGCINDNYYNNYKNAVQYADNNQYNNWSEISSSSSNNMYDEEEMEEMAREFVARYLPGVRFPKPSS